MLVEKVVNNIGKIYYVNFDNGQFDWINFLINLDFGGVWANLAGIVIVDSLVFYVYISFQQGSWEVWCLVDKGMIWLKWGDLFVCFWDVGIFVSFDNLDVLYMGEVECFCSFDGG